MTTPKTPATRKKKQPAQLASESAAKIAKRRAEVMKYVLGGATVREIAEKLGVSVGTVMGDKTAALTELAEQEHMAAKEFRQVEDTRLNAMLLAVWPDAQEGDLESINAVMRIHERKARLFGYDSIPKIELMTRDALSEFLTRLEAHLDPETFGKVLALCAIDADGS